MSTPGLPRVSTHLRHRPVIRCPRRVFLLACILLAVIPPTAAYAWSATNYSGSGVTFAPYPYGWIDTCCYKVREYNKVWRPIGKQFTLWEYNVDFSWYRTATDYSMNPFSIQGSAGYLAKAECDNDESQSVSPVTCQTTYP
jgi:hypothetical protein